MLNTVISKILILDGCYANELDRFDIGRFRVILPFRTSERRTDLSEIERYNNELEPLMPVDWRAVKQAFHERYVTEIRIIHGGLMTERAQMHLARIRARIPEHPDQIDMLLLQAFAFGAAENIQNFMRGDR